MNEHKRYSNKIRRRGVKIVWVAVNLLGMSRGAFWSKDKYNTWRPDERAALEFFLTAYDIASVEPYMKIPPKAE